jgi:hypothetical protein
MKLSLAATSIFACFGVAASAAGETWTAVLAPDAIAVPSSAGGQSTGKAAFVVNPDGTVAMEIIYDIKDPSLSANNSLIGMHIHTGNASTNGPIIFGFCGQDPLPPFGGPCKQVNDVSATYFGMICNITGEESPCYQGGNYTVAEAAQALIAGEDSKFMIHAAFNFHLHGPLTTFSVNQCTSISTQLIPLLRMEASLLD